LQAGDANATCHAIADHTNRIRAALADFLRAANVDGAAEAELV
jgi:hypothetical protein